MIAVRESSQAIEYQSAGSNASKIMSASTSHQAQTNQQIIEGASNIQQKASCSAKEGTASAKK